MKQSSKILLGKRFENNVICEEINTKRAFLEIANPLAQIASNKGLVCASSVQINNFMSIFVMLKPNLLKKDKWNQYKAKTLDYQIYLNPKILDYSI